MTAGGSGASPVRVGPILRSRLRRALGVERLAVDDPVERRSANAQRGQSLMDCLGTLGRIPHTGAKWNRGPPQPRRPVQFCATADVLGESPKECSKPTGERISRSSRVLMGQSSSLVDRPGQRSFRSSRTRRRRRLARDDRSERSDPAVRSDEAITFLRHRFVESFVACFDRDDGASFSDPRNGPSSRRSERRTIRGRDEARSRCASRRSG
jgi:hypothetical protein